jgi:putative ABC transport system ATP-binding protein
MALFGELHDQGQTIMVVTHEADIAAHAERVITLRDGIIGSDQRQTPVTARPLAVTVEG